MKTTVKLLILLVAASIVYSLESFTSPKDNDRQADSSVFKTKEGENLYLDAYAKALTLWPVKYEEKDIKTSFGKGHVIISGTERGSPLVLLHGMNASSTMWYANIKELSRDHRVYAIDYIAEPGKSVLHKNIKTKEDLIKFYTEVLEGLGLKKFDVIGASRGGWIGMQLVLESKFDIGKIVLLSPAQTFTMVKPKPKVLSNALFTLAPNRAKLKSTLKDMSSDIRRLDKLWVEQYFICLENMKTDLAFLKMDIYSDSELRSVKIPVLLLIGDHDIINNKESIQRAKSALPDCEAEIIKEAGHFHSFDQK